MSAEQIRNRTVGCKMTDSEYERLSGVVESEGGWVTLSTANLPGWPTLSGFESVARFFVRQRALTSVFCSCMPQIPLDLFSGRIAELLSPFSPVRLHAALQILTL